MSTDYTITLTLSNITTDNVMTVNTNDTTNVSFSYDVTLNQNYVYGSDNISQKVYYTDNNSNTYIINNIAYTSTAASETSPNVCSITSSSNASFETVDIYNIKSCSANSSPMFSGQGIITSSSNGTTYNNISISLKNDLETTTLTCSNYNSSSSYKPPAVGNSYNTIYTFNFGNNQIVTITLNNTLESNNLWVLNTITIVNKNNSANNNQIGIAVGFLSNIFFAIGTNPYNEPSSPFPAVSNSIKTNSIQINGMLAPILQLYL
jgi:hypothetical protein